MIPANVIKVQQGNTEMISADVFKTYNIRYRTIAPSGIVGLDYQKQEIEAKNQEHAIEILRSTVSQEGGSSLRIDRIEQLNTPPKLTERKKRSVFGMVAFSIFIIAISARLITKLF